MNNKIVCIYPVDKTTDFLLPIFERLKLEPGFVDYHFDTNDTSLVKSMKEDLSPDFITFLCHHIAHNDNQLVSNKKQGAQGGSKRKLPTFVSCIYARKRTVQAQ